MNQKGLVRRNLSEVGLAPVLIIVAILAIFLSGYYLGQKQFKPSPSPTDASLPPTGVGETANWKTYTNTTYKYLIKHPQNFKTQVLAAHAGIKEAPPNAVSLYIYDPKSEENYLNRYVNIEKFDLEPSVPGEWERSEAVIANTQATIFTDPTGKSKFDVYHIKLPNNQGVLEVYVSNATDKKDLANQILQTFKFIE